MATASGWEALRIGELRRGKRATFRAVASARRAQDTPGKTL
jgi:hypothetical protein